MGKSNTTMSDRQTSANRMRSARGGVSRKSVDGKHSNGETAREKKFENSVSFGTDVVGNIGGINVTMSNLKIPLDSRDLYRHMSKKVGISANNPTVKNADSIESKTDGGKAMMKTWIEDILVTAIGNNKQVSYEDHIVTSIISGVNQIIRSIEDNMRTSYSQGSPDYRNMDVISRLVNTLKIQDTTLASFNAMYQTMISNSLSKVPTILPSDFMDIPQAQFDLANFYVSQFLSKTYITPIVSVAEMAIAEKPVGKRKAHNIIKEDVDKMTKAVVSYLA